MLRQVIYFIEEDTDLQIRNLLTVMQQKCDLMGPSLRRLYLTLMIFTRVENNFFLTHIHTRIHTHTYAHTDNLGMFVITYF